MQKAVSSMKALVVQDYGPPQNARVDEIDAPRVKDGFLLVRMRAAGVNPFDYKLITGAVKDFVPIKFPYVPGMDGAGEVAAVGLGVEGWKEGDAIVGMFSHGTFAQYALISATEKRLAHKPEELDFQRAAAMPESALTANTMIRAGGVGPGQTVLIIGATGGVGLFATQLAKDAGARVVATGRGDDVQYLRELGADDVIDYSAGDVITQAHDRYPHGVDVVLDLINSGDGILRDGEALRESGTLVSSLYGPGQDEFAKAIEVHYIQLTAQPGDLDELAQRAASGKLRVQIGRTYDLADAAQALADLMDPARHTRGKLVIAIP